MEIRGEQIFSVPTENFAISGSESGYVLEFSVNGKIWSAWSEATPANEVCVVCNSARGLRYRLEGNTDVCYIQY